jgi:hypothetical protein
MRIIALFLLAVNLPAASRPTEWKAINYAPRGHPYYRMLYDWFTTDAATGAEVRKMAEADLSLLAQSGFNAVHLYLWDQPTFAKFVRTGAMKLPEPAGFSYPDPTRSAARQWDALDEYIGMAEKQGIWVIPHFVHTPFNDDLDALTGSQVERRAGTIAQFAGTFISYLSQRHHNVLAWGALYALSPAPNDDVAQPSNYSLLWRKVYAALKRRIAVAAAGDEPPPSFTFLYLRSQGRHAGAPGTMTGYSLDARFGKKLFASMTRHLSCELGHTAQPDLVYTYLFGPNTDELEGSLRELTTGTDAVPAERLFLSEFGISSPFGAYANATLSFGENGAPTTDLEGQADWLRQCLCSLRVLGVNKTAYWTLYDAAELWRSESWRMSAADVSLNGHFGLAFEDAERGFKPAWDVLRASNGGKTLACGETKAAVVESSDGPVRWIPLHAQRGPLQSRDYSHPERGVVGRLCGERVESWIADELICVGTAQNAGILAGSRLSAANHSV